MFADLFSSTLTSAIYRAFKIVFFLYPIWLPILLGIMFMELWLRYIRTHFVEKQGSVLLELRLPKEITRSPLSMEIFFTALYQTGAASLIETYWDGKVRPTFSLELVSIEGEVKFFIWCWPKYKNLVEAQLYAQYPNIEIHEVPDYTSWMRHDPENIPMWATYFKLEKEDMFPIKTYVDYGLDKETKEEFKIDPITSVLEYLGSLGKGEHVWIQMMIQAHKKEWFGEGRLFKREDWTVAAKNKIKDIIKNGSGKPEDQETGTLFGVTKGEAELIAGIERSIGKYPFECGIRGMYIATKENNQISRRIQGLIGAFRQYSSRFFNGFKLGKFSDFDYPWQDFRRMRRNAIERSMINAYKLRSFFQPPYKYYRGKPFILTTEELATIYHPPGAVAATPTFSRIPSKKAGAPSNLPI